MEQSFIILVGKGIESINSISWWSIYVFWLFSTNGFLLGTLVNANKHYAVAYSYNGSTTSLISSGECYLKCQQSIACSAIVVNETGDCQILPVGEMKKHANQAIFIKESQGSPQRSLLSVHLIKKAAIIHDFEGTPGMPLPIIENGNIMFSAERQSKVFLANGNGVGASFGDFAMSCTSDPSLCNNGATFSFWFKLDSLTADGLPQAILTIGGHTAGSLGFFISVKNKNIEVFVRGEGSTCIKVTTVNDFGKWYHVAFTWSGIGSKIVEMYVDGVKNIAQQTTEYGSQSVDTLTELIIGQLSRTSPGPHKPLRFSLDDFLVFHFKLHDDEIDAIYNL